MNNESDSSPIQGIIQAFLERIETVEAPIRHKLETAQLEQNKPVVIEQHIRLSMFGVSRVVSGPLARKKASVTEFALYLEHFFRYLAKEFSNQLEIAHAIGDHTNAAKTVLKLEVLQTIRNEFQDAYTQVMGERPEGVWA